MSRAVVIFCTLFLVYCSGDRSKPGSAQSDNYELQESAPSDQGGFAKVSSDKAPQESSEKRSKIIKRGNLQFEVDGLDEAKSRVDQLVHQYSAYYENEHYNSYGNRNSYSLVIRIPHVVFDSLIYTLESDLGRLVSKNISAQDVTEEYLDLEIRLENKLAYLEQYQQILRKATSIKEILEVQEKIRRIEEEIESKKARMKYLDDKVKYSTISLEISELVSRNITNKPKYGKRIANAFKNGIQAMLSFIVFLVSIWPFLLLILVLWFFRGNISRFFRRK